MSLDTFIAIVGLFIIAACFIYFCKKNKKPKNRYKNIRGFSMFFISIGIIGLIVMGFVLINHNIKTSEGKDGSGGFTIEEYKVVMDVNKTNSIDVKEYITVNFYEDYHHGIYKFIPIWLKYTNKEGQTMSRRAKVSHLTAIGDEYSVDKINEKPRIKIGNPYEYISANSPHTYKIEYTYDMGYDPYKGYDEFIFHAFGDFWNPKIKNASVEIHMPEEISDTTKINFFKDKYRNSNITKDVNYTIEGNTIYAKVKNNLNKSLTIDIELPEGYFEQANNTYGNKGLIICIICIISAIIVFLLWIKYGRDIYKVPETVEFYPPKDLDAAEIGYIYKKETGRKLAVATILQLASRGFIKIDDDGTTITISKSGIPNVDVYIGRKIKIKKLKPYTAPFFDLHIYSTEIMKRYLETEDENEVLEDFDNFYENSKYLVENGYIEIVSDSINDYTKKELNEIETEIRKERKNIEKDLTANERLVYDALFSSGDTTVLSKNTTFYRVFTEISTNVRNKFDDKIFDTSAYICMLISSIIFDINIASFAIAYFLIEDLDPKFRILYTLGFISLIIICILVILMGRRTEYGEKLKSQIKGFKNYIKLAEKNQIEKQVLENPNYFYDLLPYAYVLSVSKKWSEQFENIPLPNNDMGNLNYSDIDRINDMSSSVYTPSSSSGSSSCGGGCSSCGGGCSSCGGGGSW